MPLVGVGRYADLLRRLMGVRAGFEAPGREIAPDLNAIIVLESDRPEYHYLQGSVLVCHAREQPADAANPGKVRLRNPEGSATIAIVTSIIIGLFVSAGVGVRLRRTNTDLATVEGRGIAADTRWYDNGPIKSVSPLVLSGENTWLAPGDELYRLNVQGGESRQVFAPIVLSPGYAIEVGCFTANLNLRVSFVYYHRPIERAET